MKTKHKALLLTLCAIVLAVATAFGTLAYLTDTEAVTNTFTVGRVGLTLDETDVDNSTADKERDQANEYHLLPGHTYTKDPIIHVDSTSEDCYVFVKVENGIAAYEAATSTSENVYTSIADQIVANGWIALGGVSNVYYKEYTKGQDERDLEVFAQFKIADNANEVDGWSRIAPETTTINVTGYAVQKDGFASASAAWTATFGAPAEG